MLGLWKPLRFLTNFFITRNELEDNIFAACFLQNQSEYFHSTFRLIQEYTQIATSSGPDLVSPGSVWHPLNPVLPDRNQIWNWTGLNSIVLTNNARSQSDQIPNWLKLNHLDLQCQIKARSDIDLALTQLFCPITPDQNQIRYRTGSKSIVLTYYAGSNADQILNWLKLLKA